MKKLTLLLIIGLIITMSGCQKEEKEELTGGYTLESSVAGTLSEAAKQAYEEATSNDYHTYEPLACIKEQVVNGKNYAILAKNKDGLVILFIYKPLNGTAEITSVSNFNMQDYLTKEITIQDEQETLMGGWNTPQDGGLTTMPQALATASSRAFLDFKDLYLDPLCVLGTQVVSGINYALICRGRASNNSTKADIYLVELYVDTSSNPTITTVSPIDITKYTK